MARASNAGGPRTALVTIATALISAASAIAVAWIGILPTIRRDDEATISQLRSQVERLTAGTVQGPTWTVHGLLTRLDDGRRSPVANALVALMPVDGNRLAQYTDDMGRFAFQKIERGQYYFVFSDNYSPGTRRGIVEVAETLTEEKQFTSNVVSFSIGKD
jgi:hypothetical protein